MLPLEERDSRLLVMPDDANGGSFVECVRIRLTGIVIIIVIIHFNVAIQGVIYSGLSTSR